ncbi:DUF2231 domain-containing protein [Rhodohalobacter sp.]|uniref:DUF2231 domain-containing protein n=1 Tax=Rhodohalobacter sp. TaxID=1974210 RepID=UPI002ACDEC67|nr:DUF2231 domain-containing protein [Rhodohalobacter sp.]MDZ7755834.1 hypothetical protein [Rhodohalobacter sp.]
MVVHFPIVLLLGAAVLRIVSKFFAEEKRTFLKNASRLSLYVGVVTAWIAIYTGSLADAIVVRELCDPTVLEDHENAAYTLGIIFTIAALLAFDNLYGKDEMTESIRILDSSTIDLCLSLFQWAEFQRTQRPPSNFTR